MKLISSSKTKSGMRSLLVLPAVLLWLELMLRVRSGYAVLFPGSAEIALTALGCGLVLGALLRLLKKPGPLTVLTAVLAEILTIWFLITFFTNDFYHVYMGPLIVVQEAGNVAGGFGDTVLEVIWKGLPTILLFHLPLVLLLVFRKRLFLPGSRRLPWALLSLLLGLSAIFCGYEANMAQPSLRSQYTTDYDYNSAVPQLGALTSLGLDLHYGLNSANAAGQIAFSSETVAEAPSYTPPEKKAEPAEPAAEKMDVPETPEEAPPEEPVEYGRNELDIDFAALAEGTKDETLRSMYSYVSTQTASSKNEFTGLFKGKNLILICAESFTKEVIDPERTPTLYRMASKGIVFEDFYVPIRSGSTSTGEYQFLTGNIPANSEATKITANQNMYFTMGNVLQREGYYSLAMHNGTNDYYMRDKTHKNLGYSDWIAYGSGMENYITWQWPASDNEMITNTLPLYIDKQPFSIYYLTISGHFNYTFYGNKMCMLHQEEMEGLPYGEETRSYLAAQQEIECALTTLLDALEKAGIADDTVICLCADHYPYRYNSISELYGTYQMNSEVMGHNQAVLWCGCLEDREEPVRVSTPAWSGDLLPTLLNLFGVDFDSRLFNGRDVLAEDSRPLVIFADLSWKTEVGYFDHTANSFTVCDGFDPDADYSDYLAQMQQIVSNQYAFARGIHAVDFYGSLFGENG